MAKQNIYKLEGKSPDEVKLSFVHYMGDKNATSKQIKDAASSRYAKIDTIGVIRSLCQQLFGVDNAFAIIEAGNIAKVSDALTSLINKESDEKEQKELKNSRSYVNKYHDFLTYCDNLRENPLDSVAPYVFADDPEKTFIAEEKFNEIVELLFRKKNIILQGACHEEYPDVSRTHIHFQLMPYGMTFTKSTDEAYRLLPVMETDVTLYNTRTKKKIILDAKYYKETLVSKYGQGGKIRRDHLSQILTYVMNQESDELATKATKGILVYPSVDTELDVSYVYKNTRHIIQICTVNLNQEWQMINKRLKEIIRQ